MYSQLNFLQIRHMIVRGVENASHLHHLFLTLLDRQIIITSLLLPNLPKKHPTCSAVPYIPYIPIYTPSLNPAPYLSKKRPFKAHPILQIHLPLWLTNANDRWDLVTSHAWPCSCISLCLRLWSESAYFKQRNLVGRTLTPTFTPMNGISGSITATHQCVIARRAISQGQCYILGLAIPTIHSLLFLLHSVVSIIHSKFYLGLPHLMSP